MRSPRREHGFTLIDMLVAIALLGIMTAMALPMAGSAQRSFRLRNDAQAIANTVALAKMRAASRSARARVRVDIPARTYRLEYWNPATASWVNDSGALLLSPGVTFGFGALDTPPPNTQAAIGQSPLCRVEGALPAGATIADTACITFNSRGVPILEETGGPEGGHGLYITDGSVVYATTVTATPLVRQWQSSAAAVSWVKK